MPYPNRKIKIQLAVVLAGALLVLPLFYTYAQPSETTKSALQEVVEIKEGKIGTAESRRKALSKIIDLLLFEIADLKKQLAGIKNLGAEHGKVRRQLHNNLGDFEIYLDGLRQQLKNIPTDEAITALANEIREWREANYNPEIKNIVSFNLVFSETATIRTASARHEKIASDLNKLKFSKLIKTDLLLPLLNEAGLFIKTAQRINEKAQDRLLDEIPDQEEIKDLIENSFHNIKAAYKSYFKMSALLKEMLGL